jgi:dynein heavy chain
MPSDKLPVLFCLQGGIHITNEPCKGMPACLWRVFLDMTEADFEDCSKKREWKTLVFGLAFYHAMCLVRRTFGAVGSKIPYEWRKGDRKTATMQLQLFLEEAQGEVLFETLNTMCGALPVAASPPRWSSSPMVPSSGTTSTPASSTTPVEGALADVRAYVDQLPMEDGPDTSCLYSNADMTFQQKETKLQSIADAIGLCVPGDCDLRERIRRRLPRSATAA